MKYIFGIDGGGTKTQCYIGNEKGEKLGEGFGGKCNYQLCGIDTAKASIVMALNAALKDANISISQLTFGVLGLSGADEDIDFQLLSKMCKEVFGDIQFELLNDTWIGLRAGSSFGIASICGTGAGHAGVDKKGNKIILRNLDYELGNRGGGSEVVSDALHYAFRSNEGTYKKSKLEDMLIDIFGVSNMNQVSSIYRHNEMTTEMEYQIPIKTFELATKGDEVAIEILRDMGSTEGMYAGGIIKRLHLENEKVPLVLIGSLFKTGHLSLIDSYLKEVLKVAKEAYIVIPTVSPAQGALWLAADKIAL